MWSRSKFTFIRKIAAKIRSFWSKKAPVEGKKEQIDPEVVKKAIKVAKKQVKYKNYKAKDILKYFGKLISGGDGTCNVCGKDILKNNAKQTVYYCSKDCRRARHNKVRVQGVTNG